MRITFKGNGIVWDKDKEKTLCKFEGGHYENSVWLEGEFTTDDPGIIEKLKNYPTVPADAMKYYREEKEKSVELTLEWYEDDLEKHSVKELKEYAIKKGVDLGSSKAKADIIEVLRK